jgi:hypothetical protein
VSHCCRGHGKSGRYGGGWREEVGDGWEHTRLTSSPTLIASRREWPLHARFAGFNARPVVRLFVVWCCCCRCVSTSPRDGDPATAHGCAISLDTQFGGGGDEEVNWPCSTDTHAHVEQVAAVLPGLVPERGELPRANATNRRNFGGWEMPGCSNVHASDGDATARLGSSQIGRRFRARAVER